jgi:hypothetical protein
VAITGDAVADHQLGDDPFTALPAARTGGSRLLLPVQLSGGSAPAAILELDGSGPLAPLATAGSPSPAGPRFIDFLTPTACGGQAAFWARLEGSPAAAGLFRSSGGGLSTVALAGAPAPGGGSFVALGAQPAVDDSGRVLFLAATDPDQPADLFAAAPAGGITSLLTCGALAPGGGVLAEIQWAATDCSGQERALATVEEGSERRGVLLERIPAPI